MRFFIASPWKNKDRVQALAMDLVKGGHTTYSFVENGANFSTGRSATEELAIFSEAVEKWESDPRIKKIFDVEMENLKASDAVVLLEPAGHSSLLEAGIGYGMGKKVFVIGPIEKPEVVYLICEHFYPDVTAFLEAVTPAS